MFITLGSLNSCINLYMTDKTIKAIGNAKQKIGNND